jgi:hypothetical protein
MVRKKKERKYSYDIRCYELAEYFLSEESESEYKDRRLQELAQDLQDVVERWVTQNGVEEKPE